MSIGAVVLGHWNLAVLGFTDGAFTGKNLLELNPDLQIVTWLFQVMPLFFIVGGFTNAMSWTSSRERGLTYGGWLAARAARLIRPALWFVAFWTLLPVVAVSAGVLSAGVARIGGQEVALPLWFLAVYVIAVAAIPGLFTLYRRVGIWLTVGLSAGAFVVDNLRFGLDVRSLGFANFAFVWGAVISLGFAWRDGSLTRSARTAWAMACGGILSLVVLVAFFDYPVSMIDLTHAPRSNAQPPSLALLALAIAQCGVMLLFQRPANRWLERPRVWLAVVVANSMVMTFYLWNMSAVVLAAVLLFPTGVWPQPEVLSTTWWWLRLGWIAVCAICIVPFLVAFRWAERPAPAPHPMPEVLVGLGAIAAAAGFGLLAVHAFPVPGDALALPTIGVALVAASALLVRVDPLGPRRHPTEP